MKKKCTHENTEPFGQKIPFKGNLIALQFRVCTNCEDIQWMHIGVLPKSKHPKRKADTKWIDTAVSFNVR